MKKIFAASLCALGIQACSGGAPSTSDVEKALKADLPACENLSIENVKLTNGMKIDDLTHQVQVHFDIRVIPLPEKVLEEADKTNEQFRAEQKALLDQDKEIDAQIEDLERQLSKVGVQEQDEYNQEIHNGSGPIDVQKLQASLDEKYGLPQLRDQIQGLKAKKRDLRSAPMTKPVNLDDEWGSRACRAKSGVAGTGLGGGMEDALRKGLVTSYDATFTMQKSDNGWVEVK